MVSRRTGFVGIMASSTNSVCGSAISRKTNTMDVCDRTGSESCFGRKAEKTTCSSTQSSMTVTSLKSRLGPTIHTAMSAAVDALLGEVVIVLNETQLEMVHKDEENARLKVRLEVSERELKTLQDCLCSAQKVIDQLQISYSGAHVVSQPVFAPSLSSMTGMQRDPQNQRSVSGPDLGLGGSADESLQGFGLSNDYKMGHLSIQPDGSVTNHDMDSFGSNISHMCSNPKTDERQSHRPVSLHRFEIKEEQRPVPASMEPKKKDTGGGGEPGAQNEHGFVQVGGGGSQHCFPQPLRAQRPLQDCNAAVSADELSDLKIVSVTSMTSSISPGEAEDIAGPSGVGSAAGPTADRPHHCIECGKTFRLVSSLKKHIRIHTGEKPYPCGVCGRRFRESGALKTHLRIHTGEKPYSCSECGTCFRHLDGLRKHRRTHTGEKPYVCNICGKRLSRLQHLKHHQLIHTGERPCCCPFCNRTFKEPAALRKHVRTHQEEVNHMAIGASEDQHQEPIDDMNNLHPTAPSPQMRFEGWGTEEDSAGVDCV